MVNLTAYVEKYVARYVALLQEFDKSPYKNALSEKVNNPYVGLAGLAVINGNLERNYKKFEAAFISTSSSYTYSRPLEWAIRLARNAPILLDDLVPEAQESKDNPLVNRVTEMLEGYANASGKNNFPKDLEDKTNLLAKSFVYALTKRSEVTFNVMKSITDLMPAPGEIWQYAKRKRYWLAAAGLLFILGIGVAVCSESPVAPFIYTL